MSARQLKEELAKDQIHRKLDSTYERLNHRLGYLEARLDVGITKLQVSNTFEYHISCIDGKISVRINLLFYLFFHDRLIQHLCVSFMLDFRC